MLIRYGTNTNGKLVKKAVIYTKNEHHIKKSQVDEDALKIVSRLREASFSAYIVGGAVRDLLLGHTPKDFDIVTDATPSKIKKLFRSAHIIGKRFRLVHVIVGQKIFEVSTFRSTLSGSVGNNFGSMDEDVFRRDFTINALYYEPEKEHIIDYVGGVRDIRKNILRPIIPLDTIFLEDPVRMIRAVKYSALTGAHISFTLRHKIKSSASLLENVSASRLTEELLKIIHSGSSYKIVKEAIEMNLYAFLQVQACNLLYENKSFYNSYMESLKQLDSLTDKNARLGKKLTFLLGDFVNILTDWEKEKNAKTPALELYAATWKACRQFILPMNPKRTELEFAVKQLLLDKGIKFRPKKKRSHTAPSEE